MSDGLKLYEMADDLQAIMDVIEEAGGEITPETEEALDALGGEFNAKAERVALYYRQLSANADAASAVAGVAKAEAKRLDDRAKTFTRAADSLKKYLHMQMTRADVRKIETPLVSMTRQKNQAKVVWTKDVGRLPLAFARVKTEPNLSLANQWLKEGKKLPAGFVVKTDGEHLRIR